MANGTEDLAVQLAKLQEQVASMAASVEDVRTSVREVLSLDRTIAELSVRHRQHASEIAQQWTRIDTLKGSVDATDKKSDEWINKARGAWFTAVILGSIAQIAVIAMIGWVFTHVNLAEDQLYLLQYRVQQIESKVKP